MTLGVASGFSQNTDGPDRAAYQSFFQVVAQLSRFLPAGTNRLTEPTIQDALGFTDAEMMHLNAVATVCEA